MSDYLEGYEDGRKSGRLEAVGWVITGAGISILPAAALFL